jgi:hypothetical protein
VANATSTCVNGACGYVCNSGFADCDGNPANGCETNLSADANNCGACGQACAAGQVCSGGQCSSNCPNGQVNCNGKCVSLTTDPNNCGGCGMTCSPVPNATATCTNGKCGYVCNSGFADCDANTANGCETNLNVDANNCGACGKVCASGQVCNGGVCL